MRCFPSLSGGISRPRSLCRNVTSLSVQGGVWSGDGRSKIFSGNLPVAYNFFHIPSGDVGVFEVGVSLNWALVSGDVNVDFSSQNLRDPTPFLVAGSDNCRSSATLEIAPPRQFISCWRSLGQRRDPGARGRSHTGNRATASAPADLGAGEHLFRLPGRRAVSRQRPETPRHLPLFSLLP